jgi:hypothetical protein
MPDEAAPDITARVRARLSIVLFLWSLFKSLTAKA